MIGDIKRGDLVKALELVDHNKTKVYSVGILLDLETIDFEPVSLGPHLIATILEHSGNIKSFTCESQPAEWLGTVWLVKAHENDDE